MDLKLSWVHKLLSVESYKDMNSWFCNNKSLALLQQKIHCQHFTVPIWEKKQLQNHLNMKATIVEEAMVFQTKTNNKDLPSTGTDIGKIAT